MIHNKETYLTSIVVNIKNDVIEEKNRIDEKINHIIEITKSYLGNVTEPFKANEHGFTIEFENGSLDFVQISPILTNIHLIQKIN